MSHPIGCYVELADGRTGSYQGQRKQDKCTFYTININGGGIDTVGEKMIKLIDDNRPGWK